jgi:hypothetical protein
MAFAVSLVYPSVRLGWVDGEGRVECLSGQRSTRRGAAVSRARLESGIRSNGQKGFPDA